MIDLEKLRKSKGYVLAIVNTKTGEYEPVSKEVQQVRHGKWIPCAKSGLILTEQMRKEGIRWYGFKCSVCNFIRKGNAPIEANYCECCGARMDEE